MYVGAMPGFIFDIIELLDFILLTAIWFKFMLLSYMAWRQSYSLLVFSLFFENGWEVVRSWLCAYICINYGSTLLVKDVFAYSYCIYCHFCDG